MLKPKKIKIKSSYLLGRKEHERYFLSNGIYMFDVTDHLERLPDDVQLAFQLWSRWNKYGKDQPFREDKPDEKVTEQSAWDQVLLNRGASFKGKPCPLLYCAPDDGLYRGITNLGQTFWAFVNEEAYQLALEIWDETEVEFHVGDEETIPVSIVVALQRVGIIGQYKGVPERMLSWGFPHFLQQFPETKSPIEPSEELCQQLADAAVAAGGESIGEVTVSMGGKSAKAKAKA